MHVIVVNIHNKNAWNIPGTRDKKYGATPPCQVNKMGSTTNMNADKFFQNTPHIRHMLIPVLHTEKVMSPSAAKAHDYRCNSHSVHAKGSRLRKGGGNGGEGGSGKSEELHL